MNKKFLPVLMAVVVGSAMFTGCGSSKNENTTMIEETVKIEEETTEIEDLSEEVETVIEETEETKEVVEEEIQTESEEEITESEEEITESEEVEKEVIEVVEDDSDYNNAEDYAGIDPTATQEMIFVITDGIELPVRANMDASMFAKTYDIASNVLKSYTISAPIEGEHATEIAVFEVKDSTGHEAVRAGVEKRISELKKQWETKSSEQYNLVKNYKIVEKGNFILFVVSKEADVIVSKFQSAF